MKTFTKEELIERVTEAITSCTGTLITVDRAGFPRARVLEDHNPYEGFTFWFATHVHTRKIAEIEGHPGVCIMYQPPSVAGYICIMGTAQIRTDEEARRFIWREEWAKYYEGPMASDFVPIQVIPSRIEFYDANIGAHAEEGFGPVVVEL
ncbi:MAG: pyridoxamine 5'-phosphate oxidase family protein [Candidatus Latescibacteria bacterium]|nr:pyridoxamine 5'-phosphate oxidase family protein [Candidatus Latescibacterota bacterium]